MKTFTKQEVDKLISEKRISQKDAMRLAILGEHEDKPSVKPDILADIRDALNKIVVLGEREVAKSPEKIVVQPTAPVVNVSIPEETEEKKKWNFTVKRDSRGFIESVTAVQQ